MQSMQLGTYDVMIRNVVEYYTGYVQIHQKGYYNDPQPDNGMEIDPKEIVVIQKTEGVKTVLRRIENFALLSSDVHTKGALVIGTDPEPENQLTGLKQKVVQGSYFSNTDPGALLAEGLAEQLHVKPGDSVVILSQGYQGNSATGLYKVSGILKFGSPELNKRMFYLPLSAAEELFSMPGMATSICLGLTDGDQTEKTAALLKSTLDTSVLEVMTWPELLPDLQQGIEADYVGGYIMLGILYMIICFGIFGTLLMMLSERKHEFGVLIAIGMKRSRLALTVFLELLLVTLLGALSGMLASIPVISYFYYNPLKFEGKMAESYENFGFEPMMQASTDPGIFIRNGLLVMLLSVILCLYPFIKIQGMRAIDAMKR